MVEEFGCLQNFIINNIGKKIQLYIFLTLFVLTYNGKDVFL